MEEAQKKNGFNKPLRIAVVGGGLVGSLCACFMAKRGFTVDLYEYREDIRKADLVKGRSINLSMSNRARAALRVIGLEDHMVNEHGIPMCGRLIHKTNGSLRAIPYDVLSKQCIYSVGRKYLNEVLLSAAEKYSNVNLHFNHKLINARLNEGKLTLLRTDTNTTIEIEADLVIGADGAFSTVRKHMMKMPMFDFSQTYIETGYLELCIPPDEDGKFQINPNYLHIWPRGEFMMIALPNQDCSYTVTLFMPFGEFRSLRTSDQLLDFFDVNFPDAVPLIGRDRLVKDFFGTTPSPLVSIKCKPYHLGNRCVIIGDAAHAMVPFYGQGMNAGFEDCLLLDKLLDEHRCDMTTVLRSFTEMRVDDAHTICDLAMYNYVEMRDLVTRKSFLIRKKVDDILYRTIPTKWVPLYNSVTFTDLGYLQCLKNRKWQNKVLTRVGLQLPVAVALICLILFMYYRTFLNNNYFFEKILTFNS